MNKKDLVKKVHSQAYKLTRDEVRVLIDLMFDAIAEELIAGNEINVRGFGRFFVETQKEKVILHPRTREKIITSPKLIRFRPSKNLKRVVKKK